MKNLKQTKRQQNLNRIEQIKDLGTSMDEYVRVNVLDSYDKAINDVIIRIQNNINKNDLPVTGKINDIRISSTNGTTIDIIANKQLVFQSRGVSGTKKKRNTPHFYSDKKPPVQPILDWLKRRNINTSRNEELFNEEVEFTDNEKLQLKIAYAIRESIFQNGFKGYDLYEKEIPKLIEDLRAAGIQAVIQSINQVVVGIKESAQRNIIKKK
jgi:hypothetical protein